MKVIKNIFSHSQDPYSRNEKPERALADPMMVRLFEQARGHGMDRLQGVVHFVLSHNVKKPTFFTKKSSRLDVLVTIVTNKVFYVHTDDEIGGGTFKKAFGVFKVEIPKGLIKKYCERTVKDSPKHPHNIENALAENKFAATFRHPNVMGESELALLHETEEGVKELSLFDPLMDGDGKALLNDPAITREERIKFVADVGRGLLYLHSLNVVHRDLKPANILWQRIEGRLVAKISDFGTSTYAANIKAGTYIGTVIFLPQAILKGTENQGFATDAYSYGIVSGMYLRPLDSKGYEGWYKSLMAPRAEDRPTMSKAMGQFKTL